MAKLVPVENIEDGMILAEPIVNKQGQTLMPSGVLLKDNHIKILKIWNIRTISVKSKENEEGLQLSPEIVRLATIKLSQKMTWKPRNNYEKDLYKMGVLNLAKNMSKTTRGM